MRYFSVDNLGIAAAIAVLCGAAAFAQEANDEPADEAPVATSQEIEELEEIIVIAPKPGSRKRVDQEYEDPVRAQLLKDFYKMQDDQEEFEWRDTAAKTPSRITWGYDPRDEYRMRNEMDLQSLPSENVRPATLFRVDF
jgi:hypothetical protein